MEKEGGVSLKEQAALVAGHSLGEYSALAAAGTLTVSDAARLLRIRGRAMQKAVPPGEGAMAALIGVELGAGCRDMRGGRAGAGERRNWREAAGEKEVIEPANDNGGGQVVVSGHRGRGGAGRRDRQGTRRAPGDAAAGLGTVPLRAHGASRRGDGRGVGYGLARAASCSRGRQCVGR